MSIKARIRNTLQKLLAVISNVYRKHNIKKLDAVCSSWAYNFTPTTKKK
jgi:hypothetical protein